MRQFLITFFLFISLAAYSQIPLYQLEYAPDSNYIIGAKMDGEPLWIDASLLGKTDSIFLRNDTIFLKNGSGFVKIPKIKAGQTVTVQTLITGDTIYAEVNTSSLDSTHIKAGSVSLTDLAFTPLTNITGTSPITISGSGNSRNVSYTGLTGTGTINNMSKWTTTTNLGNSEMWNDGVTTWIGTKQSLGKFEVNKSWSGADQQNILASGNIPMIGLRNNQYQFNFGSGYVGNNVLSILGSGGIGQSPVSQLVNIYNNGDTQFNGIENKFANNIRLITGISQFTLGASTNPASVQAYFNLASGQRFRIQGAAGLSYMDFYTPATGSNRNFSFATSYFNAGDFNLLKSSTAGGSPTTRIWTANDTGFGIATDPQYTLDVGGSARIQNRSGSAIVGAGFDANGKLVEYNLDTAIVLPETYLNGSTNISVTGNGSFATPYVISNTFSQIYQTLSTNGEAGNITLSNSGGTLILNVNDADASTTNEKINSISVTGNTLTITENGINYTATVDGDATNELQDLFPHSNGFILSHPTPSLQDTVIFQYSANIISTPPTGCNCGILDIPNLQSTLDGKALTSHTHTIPNITGLQAALDAKENTFAKGNILQGTGVTITGTLTNRLVGSGDVTINASGGGVTLSEAIVASYIAFSNTTQVLSISLAAGTYKLDAICTIYNETASVNNFGIVLKNNTTNSNLFQSSADILGLSGGTVVAARNITIGSTNTIVVNSTTVVDAAILPNTCILTALKIN